MESNFANNMELFNEVITLFVLYLLMCFSDFVADPETRNECGKALIALCCCYALVHILFLIINTVLQIRHLIRSKYYARRNKKILLKNQEQ